MTFNLIGICGRCAKKKPPNAPLERQRLRRGPDGNKLCSRHANEAWDNTQYSTGSDREDPR